MDDHHLNHIKNLEKKVSNQFIFSNKYFQNSNKKAGIFWNLLSSVKFDHFYYFWKKLPIFMSQYWKKNPC